MDPLATIVTALAAGAASVATSVVKDVYEGLKGLIARKYGAQAFDVLEAEPGSRARQAVIQEDLERADVGTDEEVLRAAQAVLTAVQESGVAAGTTGVDLERVQAAQLTIERVLAEGPGATGVRASDVDVAGAVEIRDVEARGQAPKA